MARLVEPRVLKGFRDYPPALMIPRERLMETARQRLPLLRLRPIDTPAIELTEVLLGKVEPGAEINKQLYRFKDAGDRDVALRFDLTVPLARFAAQHFTELGMPFKRYHLGTVWRGESPQAGRFREFLQCDFDTIGTLSNAADVEIALVINDLFVALGFDRFEIRVNNRLVLNGLLAQLGLEGKTSALLRSLDKLAKIGRDKVIAEMVAGGRRRRPSRPAQVIALAETTGSNADILDQLDRRFADNAEASKGVANLRELVDVFRTAGVPEGRLQLDLSICRGLDYYTGTIYETFLLDMPEIGSVCSGGRYDNLAGSLHEAVAARRRGVARPGPAAGGDGGAGPAAEDGDAGPGAGAAVRRRAARRLPADRPDAAGRGHRHGGLPGGEEARPAVPVRRATRLPRRR